MQKANRNMHSLKNIFHSMNKKRIVKQTKEFLARKGEFNFSQFISRFCKQINSIISYDVIQKTNGQRIRTSKKLLLFLIKNLIIQKNLAKFPDSLNFRTLKVI